MFCRCGDVPQFNHRKCAGCGGIVSRIRRIPGINSSALAEVHMLSVPYR